MTPENINQGCQNWVYDTFSLEEPKSIQLVRDVWVKFGDCFIPSMRRGTSRTASNVETLKAYNAKVQEAGGFENYVNKLLAAAPADADLKSYENYLRLADTRIYRSRHIENSTLVRWM